MALSVLKYVRPARHGVLRVLAFVRFRSKATSIQDVPELQEPEERKYYSSYEQSTAGSRVYDKKPFKFLCKEGKAYHWCSCGYSKMQPFCDGTHKSPFLKIKLRPVRFVCKETREYWFCNCKQTKHKPYCDGTHKTPEVQEAPSTIKW